MMVKFDKYWEQYGELHASMCNGDIKQFAKEIWQSANGRLEKENEELKRQRDNTQKRYENRELMLQECQEYHENKIAQLEKKNKDIQESS